ncbi:MAG: hypothetical protein JWO05_750 [Gemmatimonadetes bacterium]|nr:hypothetical protein [Gemmatimonadota bacterium]
MSSLLDRIARRIRALRNPDALDRELAAEMHAHIDLESQELVRAQGLSPEEARRRATLAFGGVDRFTEAHRDERGVRWLSELWADVRYSARVLTSSPAFTISSVLVLALGIGASTAMFSAVDAVLLSHLPYHDDEQLVRIFEQDSPTNRWTMSDVDYQAIERDTHSFSAVGAARPGATSVSAGGDAERRPAAYITAGFLQALDVNVLAGRRLTLADEQPSAPAVTVITEQLATEKFGSPSAAVGRTVTIDGLAHQVVGVLPAAHASLANRQADVWPVMKRATPKRRGPFGLFVIGRLAPGVTMASARRELNDISVRIFPEWQSGFQDRAARLTPYGLRETIIGDASRPLSLFVGAVALVLLIAVSNVASLAIVRFMRRWRELSLRAVLGATRGRLVRLMITESVLLSVSAGVLGVALGWLGLRLLQGFVTGIPRLSEAHLDLRAISVALTVALLSGIAIGAVPALRLLTKGADGLRDGTRAIGDGKLTTRLRAAFVAAEFGLALPVLVAGALLLASVARLQRVNPGFDSRDVLTMTVGLPSATYSDNSSMARLFTRVSSELTQLPGVTSAAYSTAMPPDDQGNNNNNFNLVDQPVAPGAAQPTVTWPTVTPEFFGALGVPLLEGRMFDASDTLKGIPVVVVTRSWAKHYYPDRPAVGRELISGGCTACPHTVVIGVVGDMTFDRLGEPGEAVFSPLSQGWGQPLFLFVKGDDRDGSLARRVRDVVHSADAGAAMSTTISLDERIHSSVAAPRQLAIMLATFAGAALLMAAVGIFGLLSYAVALRKREIGVRMALGAQRSQVVGSMIGGGMRYAGIGTLVGLSLSVVASRWLSGSLFEVSAVDPATLGAVSAGLLGVALVASWIPAMRAAAIDPVDAMRPE